MSSTNSPLGEKIRFARVLGGLSQQELGDALSVSRQFIHQIESDIRTPSSDLLDLICETLCVTQSFLSDTIIKEIKPEQFHFRKRRSTSLGLTLRVSAFGAFIDYVLQYLEQFVELPDPFAFEILSDEINIDGTYSREHIEKISERFRVEFGLGTDTPIDNLVVLLEALGVVITSFSGVSEKVDALSFTKRRHYILRNTAKQSASRQRFDLAHEFGHLILHQGVETGCSVTEPEADQFASAFLFPRKAFIREFPRCVTLAGQFRWAAMEELKVRWSMSLRAIVYRAHSLGLIDSRQYRAGNVKLSKDGLPEMGEHRLPEENPSMITDTFELMRDEMGMDCRAIAKALGLQSQLLSSLLGVTDPTPVAETNVVGMKPMRFLPF